MADLAAASVRPKLRLAVDEDLIPNSGTHCNNAKAVLLLRGAIAVSRRGNVVQQVDCCPWPETLKIGNHVDGLFRSRSPYRWGCDNSPQGIDWSRKGDANASRRSAAQ